MATGLGTPAGAGVPISAAAAGDPTSAAATEGSTASTASTGSTPAAGAGGTTTDGASPTSGGGSTTTTGPPTDGGSGGSGDAGSPTGGSTPSADPKPDPTTPAPTAATTSPTTGTPSTGTGTPGTPGTPGTSPPTTGTPSAGITSPGSASCSPTASATSACPTQPEDCLANIASSAFVPACESPSPTACPPKATVSRVPVIATNGVVAASGSAATGGHTDSCAPPPPGPAPCPSATSTPAGSADADCPGRSCPSTSAAPTHRTADATCPTGTGNSPQCPSLRPGQPGHSASGAAPAPAATPICRSDPGTTDHPTEQPTKVTCSDGSVRDRADQCPLPQRSCPGTSVGVPVGTACPSPPTPTAPVPVICWDGSQHAATADCPSGRVMCPGGISVPLEQTCPSPEPTRCARGTVRVLGVCTPVRRASDPVPPVGQPEVREAKAGELLFDRTIVSAGDTLFARGAGCDPGAQATLTTGGELVGRAVADRSGTFETVVQFASFEPGHRPVEARCAGEKPLTAGIDMVLVAADTSASATSVLLPLFLALSFLAVHYQMAARRRRRGRVRR